MLKLEWFMKDAINFWLTFTEMILLICFLIWFKDVIVLFIVFSFHIPMARRRLLR
ncbi:hypothetical protein FC75_GL002116 [Lacticaseibacillus camelliae DSM 22697 = JCM 13995]|uniref:Uncharacterized protein n=1 Tax=Lacticaseibacillus camelliae DSM 22697 = JCM 13995 TaxID=1423730 RepID=A0A0R2F7Y9_9LACO|nr:hypothetical protein FC75_GL002116 [Lacticaseibacillus camelliae DSM 22697 = JCM 13995]